MNPSVTYILWEFPTISETFISNEIRALVQKHGLNVKIFSNKKPRQEKVHEETKAFISSTDYLPSLVSFPNLRALFYFLFRHPVRFFRIILQVIRMVPFNHPRIIPYFIAQSGCCFLKACYISRKINADKPVHLHSHYAESAAFITMLVSFFTDVPYSFTMHAHDIFINKNKQMIVHLIKNSDFAVTISKFNQRYLTELDRSLADKIHIVHCGIDVNKFKPARKTLKGRFQLLTVARLVKTKGVHKVIQALASIENKNGLIYKVIGSGPEAENLRALIAETHMSGHVDLMGAQTSRVVQKELNTSDVFVLHCLIGEDGNMDGIPVALMEAMAMKLPVISTKLSGIPELIKDGSGFMSDPDDDEALVTNLKRMMALSDADRQKMGEIGRSIIEEEFNLETETKKLRDLFLRNHAEH